MRTGLVTPIIVITLRRRRGIIHTTSVRVRGRRPLLSLSRGLGLGASPRYNLRIRYCLAIAYSGRDAPRLRRARARTAPSERNVPRPGHASPGGAGDRTPHLSGRLRSALESDPSTRRSTSDTHRLTIPGVRIFYTVNTRPRAMDSAMCQAATPRRDRHDGAATASRRRPTRHTAY